MTVRAGGRDRVVIVEDHALFAESLAVALEVAGYAVARVDAPAEPVPLGPVAARIRRLRPSVVLVDLDLGRFGSGTPLIEQLVRAGLAVVVVTGSAETRQWGGALHAGACTVLSKTRPLGDVLATVQAVCAGRAVLAPAERDALVRGWAAQHVLDRVDRERLDRLTGRESEVLGELMLGRTVREIAEHGVVSEATVRTQVKAILAKLEVSSQLAAVGAAHRVGWRTPARLEDPVSR